MEYVKPDLLVVTVACYLVGVALKSTTLFKDKRIPLVLGLFSVMTCMLWSLTTAQLFTVQDILMAVFNGITQGILAAGLSTYVNQLFKQITKEE